MKRTLLFLAAAVFPFILAAQNPILPLWEFIPDGEPYVFEDPDAPGHYRVYLYGSHDSFVSEYCGREQVLWSAPVEDLTAWRYDGVIFRNENDVLYAPDVAFRVLPSGEKEYWFYPNNQAWPGMAAKSNRPDGPFVVSNWAPDNSGKVVGVLGFDPAVFVDDDGRVYGYWGFGHSHGAELDPKTMATVKEGTQVVENMVSGYEEEGVFRFYEASSMRKIGGKYVFIYSRMTATGENGLPQCNYSLAYAYSDHPLGPFTYGGTLIDARAPETLPSGQTIPTACPFGNTHGSMVEIGGEWWLFYHRQTGTDEYSRQAMVAPLSVKVDKRPGGKVTISQAEYTSEGFLTGGLDPFRRIPAGLACYFTHPLPAQQQYPNFIFSGAYVKPVRYQPDSFQGPYNQKLPFAPVVNTTAGSTVGYKYLNTSSLGKARFLELRLAPEGVPGQIDVLLGAPDGQCIASLSLDGSKACMQTVRVPLEHIGKPKGKQALYFVFTSPIPGKSLCTFYDFLFL